MSSPAAAATTTDPGESPASQHKLKLKPPSYDGDYTTIEDWHYKFKAYIGVQHKFCSQFLPRAAQSPTRLAEAELRGAAASQQEVDEWLQLDRNLKYLLINSLQQPHYADSINMRLELRSTDNYAYDSKHH